MTDRRVSSAALEPYFAALRPHGIPVSDYIAGLPFDEAYVRDTRNRISWDSFCTLTERLSAIVGGAEGLRAVGNTVNEGARFKVIGRIFGLMAGPQQLYHVACHWAQPQMWPMCSSETTALSPTRYQIVSSVPRDYHPCPGFFEVVAGSMELMPTTLGMAPATVELDCDGHTATFQITHPPSMTAFARLRRLLRAPWASRALLREQQSQIAELNQRLIELSHARKRATAAEQTRRNFLSNMGHELRTPLNAIFGAVDSLADQSRGELQQSAVRRLSAAREQLLELVNETLDLSTLDAERLDIDLEPTDTRALLEQIVSAAQPQAASRGVHARLDIDAAVPKIVHTDPKRLRLVLRNLLDTLIAAAPAGEVALHAHGATTGRRFQLLLDLTAPPAAPTVPSLSLSVAKTITEMLGGQFQLGSAPSEPRFRLSLELAAS